MWEGRNVNIWMYESRRVKVRAKLRMHIEENERDKHILYLKDERGKVRG